MFRKDLDPCFFLKLGSVGSIFVLLQIKHLEEMIRTNAPTSQFNTKASTLSVQLIVVLLELVITVVCASLSCRACCCLPSTDTTAVYVPKEFRRICVTAKLSA